MKRPEGTRREDRVGFPPDTEASLLLAVQKAQRALARRLDADLLPLGLTGDQVMVLATVARMQGPRAADLARELVKDHSTVSASLKLLLGKDLLRSRGDPTDRRGHLLSLTLTGRERLSSAWVIVRAVEREASSRLGGDLESFLRELADVARPRTT